ncbi:MAG TPA: TonB-dependent receptor [Bryobacteraceae bacterium]|jgi:outer membrane receptor protein involved in Fe transport|nr:TonB-dependent receptor [Bryobacteraceae bacterium]
MNPRFLRALTALRIVLCAALCITGLPAQTPSGEIRIEVRDASGAGMQAAGKLESNSQQIVRNFVTDPQGFYTVQDLPFGRYRLEISRDGFNSPAVGIDVRSATPVSRTVTMALARAASKVDVVATTPLSGTDRTIDQIASPVQTATAADVENSGAIDLSEFMNRRLNGVSVNETQANPFQPDVNFRGYTASPLLGTPEGISVYLDGVRQNQPFGDVVSWDLIPRNAISEITLMPGSDPLFGLNTLGGALSVQTKSGLTDPGIEGNLTYGSSGRKAVQASYGGGKATGFNWFLSGNGFHESGWRVDSPSDVRQGFARLGWRTDKTDLALTMSYAYNTLLGNGLQDYRLIGAGYSSDYSIADSTANRSPSFNFIGRHTFSSALSFSGNVWYRNIRTEGINPNINGDSLDQSVYQPNASEQAALTAAGYTGFPTSGANASNTPFPKWRCIANALTLNDPDERCNSIVIDSKSVQNEYGFSGQVTWVTSPRATSTKPGRNQFTAGVSVVRGNVNYTQNANFGYLNPDRTITSVPAWLDGSTVIDSRVNLHGNTPNFSLYFTDTFTLASKLNLTVSGRYNRLTVDNTDRISPIAGPGSLDGNYVFERFNPAVGITWSPLSSLNIFGGYTQGSRAPTSIELGCADPANPCSLPNALASDPPLQQVVTGTWEVGVRGKPELSFVRNLSWSASAFRADNRNDILFVSSPQTGSGYFQNFAKTRRQGAEADLNGRISRVTWGLDYTFLVATYQSVAIVDGSANSTSDSALAGTPGLDGNIVIHPGNRIPLVPKQTGKAFIDVNATSKLSFDFNEVTVSSSYMRGNENNAYKADGKYYLGPGVMPGYAVTNFRAHYDLTRRLQLAVQIDNVFDRHFFTAGQLATTALTPLGAFLARPFPAYTSGPQAGNYPLEHAAFFTPGAPRRAWAELRLKF